MAAPLSVSKKFFTQLAAVFPLQELLLRILLFISITFCIDLTPNLYDQIGLFFLALFLLWSRTSRWAFIAIPLIILVYGYLQGGELTQMAFLLPIWPLAILDYVASRNHQKRMRTLYLARTHFPLEEKEPTLNKLGLLTHLIATTLLQITLLLITTTAIGMPLRPIALIPILLFCISLMGFILITPYKRTGWIYLTLTNLICILSLCLSFDFFRLVGLIIILVIATPWGVIFPSIPGIQPIQIGYDGECSLCNRFILNLIDNLPHEGIGSNISFFPLPQNRYKEPRTILAIENGVEYKGIYALKKIAQAIGGFIGFIEYGSCFIPDSILNHIYGFISRQRYFIWGVASQEIQCQLLLYQEKKRKAP